MWENTNSLIQEASLLDILMAEVGSIIDGMAKEVYAMQMPNDRQPVETAAAANTWRNEKYLNCSAGLEISGTSTKLYLCTQRRIVLQEWVKRELTTEGFSLHYF